MSRRSTRLALAAALAVVATLATAPRVQAQTGSEDLFLLLPIGARAVGVGESVVAEKGGSDMLFWNPAGIAGSGKHDHEIALHHSETVVGQGNAIAAVIPTTTAGTFGLALNILDLGQIPLTDEQGIQQGTITPIDVAIGVTYAPPPIGPLAFGVTAKHIASREQCTGFCDRVGPNTSANGADVGVQLRFPQSRISFGAAGRNLGLRSSGNDPARIDLGGDYLVPIPAEYIGHIEAHATAAVATTTSLDSAVQSIGADVALEQKLHVRAGYIRDHSRAESGAAVGIGITSGSLVFDIARAYGGLTSDGDKQPWYFTLRYVW